MEMSNSPRPVSGGDTDGQVKVDAVLTTAETLMEEGRWREAIDSLNRANRLHRDREIERRLVRLRHEAFNRLEHRSTSPRWSRGVPSQVPPGVPPEVSADELTADALTSA